MKKLITLAFVLFFLIPISISTASEKNGEGHVCFRRIDTNHDDMVTKEELSKVFPTEPELFQEIDQDNDGKITHEEYEKEKTEILAQ